eukprot:g14121.t1
MGMEHLPSSMWNTTSSGGSSRELRLYHVDVTGRGEPCVRNELLDRVVDTSTYEYGCRDIQYMLTGPKTLVGSGSVRDVWSVEYKGRTVVVKTLRHMDDQRHRDMHAREMLTMDILRHERNIIGMLGVCETTVVTEYYSTKLLHYVWRNGKDLEIRELVSMSIDAAKGLQALHEIAGCLHIDLKPMQLLVDEEGRVKLNDFNSVHVMNRNPMDGTFCPAWSAKRNRREPWPSPENFAGKLLTEKTDVYSLGMIFYSLLIGGKPFGDNADHFDQALEGKYRPPMDPSWHRGYTQVVEDMWLQDPKRRPSARQVVARLQDIQGKLARQ